MSNSSSNSRPNLQTLHPALRTETQRVFDFFYKRIENVGAYTAKSLANAPKRVKARWPKKGKQVDNRNYFTIPKLLYHYSGFTLTRTDRPISDYIQELRRRQAKEGLDYVEPNPYEVMRKGAEPGKVPKSWPGYGKSHFFLSQWEGGTDEATGKKKFYNNWRLEKVDDLTWTVSIRALGGRGEDFLGILEHGGNTESSRYMIGLNVLTHRKYNGKKTVEFLPVWSGRKSISVRPRPFVKPTLDRVRERIQRDNDRTVKFKVPID